VSARNKKNWYQRLRRLYIVEYPALGWFKVGIEANVKGYRVKKWCNAGGVLAGEITVDRSKVSRLGYSLFLLERRLVSGIFPELFETPTALEYRQAVTDDGDGFTETFKLGGASVSTVVDIAIREWGKTVTSNAA